MIIFYNFLKERVSKSSSSKSSPFFLPNPPNFPPNFPFPPFSSFFLPFPLASLPLASFPLPLASFSFSFLSFFFFSASLLLYDFDLCGITSSSFVFFDFKVFKPKNAPKSSLTAGGGCTGLGMSSLLITYKLILRLAISEL